MVEEEDLGGVDGEEEKAEVNLKLDSRHINYHHYYLYRLITSLAY